MFFFAQKVAKRWVSRTTCNMPHNFKRDQHRRVARVGALQRGGRSAPWKGPALRKGFPSAPGAKGYARPELSGATPFTVQNGIFWGKRTSDIPQQRTEHQGRDDADRLHCSPIALDRARTFSENGHKFKMLQDKNKALLKLRHCILSK